MPLDPTLAAFAPVLGIVLAVAGVGVGIASLALRKKDPKLAREIALRYVAWVGIVALLLGALALGRGAWIALVAILSVLAVREFARAVGLWLDRAFLGVVYALVLLTFVVAWWPWATEVGADGAPARGWYGLFVALPAWGTLFLLLVPIVRGKYEHMLQRLALAIVAFLYLGWMLAHAAFLANLPGGVGLILFLCFLVAVNDIAAFVCGKLFGRHKLRPLLSPGKTWEGAIGAIVCVAIAGWLLAWLVPAFPPAHVVVVSVLVGVAGTVGDLALATIKRDVGLKDWGDLIPGHGGILDRLNSLIFAAPLFFHYTRYFFT